MMKLSPIIVSLGMLGCMAGCTAKPEVQYVDRYIEVPTAHGTHEGFIWDPYTKEDKIIIICDDCGKQLGEINKITKTVTIEKEVEKIVYQEVPIEIVIEKIVEVEKEVQIIKEVEKLSFHCLTWEEILNLKRGDILSNILIYKSYFCRPNCLSALSDGNLTRYFGSVELRQPFATYGNYITWNTAAEECDNEILVLNGTVLELEKTYDDGCGNVRYKCWINVTSCETLYNYIILE